MSPAPNLHATCIVVAGRGLLIIGPSGSGKTTLALTLIDSLRSGNRFARLVADDQVLVHARHDRLVATAPHATTGLVEVFGLGPRSEASLPAAVIDVVCRLVPPSDGPRFQEPVTEEVHGIALPMLRLGERDAAASARAIVAWLACPDRC